MEHNINKQKIKEYLEKNNLSKNEFCKQAKIGVATLNKILNNQGDVMLITLFKVANKMKMNIIDLLT